MNRNTRYSTSGNLALAYPEEGEQRFVLIKHAGTQQHTRKVQARVAPIANTSAKELHRLYRLQDLLEDSYRPERDVLDALGGWCHGAKEAFARNPLVYQLLHGSAKGDPIEREAIVPVAITSSLCTAISVIAVFVGC